MLAGIRTSSKLVHVPIVKFFGLIVLPLLMFASSAPAEGSEEQLQNTIDGIIKVLKTIRTPADIDKNRNAIRQLLLTRFDLAAMAQRSLGNRWNDLRGNQQESVSVFTEFVEHGYKSTLGSYGGERVVYDQDRVNEESAEVDTRVVAGEGAPIKICYQLHLTGIEWIVYDAVIDDVSVISKYRTQLARILRTASLEEPIQSLRAKVSDR
jgi:phospholipid transport system substrate-binding protein